MPPREHAGEPVEPPTPVAARPRSPEAERAQPADARVAELEREVAELHERLEESEREARAMTVRAHEANAELENAKSRIRREAAKDVERRKRSILEDLLDVLDNLDRAIASARAGGDETSLLEGVELVRDDFLRKLEQLGVTRETSEGEPFDPTRHEAVSRVPVTHPDARGKVVAVIREGYRIGDAILRPAHVAVGA